MATAVFLGVTASGAHGTALGYVQAAAEASMVGGAADWFAVTALFRRPLGLPIPHTALIVERKDQFAATLGQFFQENFLNADVLVERIKSARLAPRLAAWTADPGNAARLADYAAHLVSQVAVLLSDEDVHDLLTDQLTGAVERLDLPALFAGGVRAATAADGGSEIFEVTVSAVDRYLAAHKEDLSTLFVAQSPAWVPHAVSRRLFDQLHGRMRRKLVDMTTDPGDETRQRFQQWIAGLPERIKSSPEVRDRAEALLRDVLAHDELRSWSSTVWHEVRESLRRQAADPASELRRRLTDGFLAAGRRVGADSHLQDSITRGVESTARALAEQFRDEAAALVTTTVERWDASETATQLELLLGRDLQFIRINGTLVGAVVGVGLHALSLAFR
ncbi:MAG TPA: DUF445 domain-containing protein [Acidimicrobiales bacterium]|nr:DUF445 domain-containing protein [Acidimicrobiales bacterium]